MAVAQFETLWAPASSFTVWFAPLVKLGASFTGFTVIVKVWMALVSTPPLAVPPSSWIWTETVAEPLALAAGVKESVPLAPTAGWLENRPVLSLETMKLTVWPLSLAGPLEIEVAQPEMLWAAASSFTVWFAPLTKLGTSFTGFTVMVKVWMALVSTPPLAVPPSSWIWTETVAEPFAL